MLKKVLKNLYLHTEEFISVVFITIALILLTLQVILRFVFNTSFGWIEELSRYLYIWVIYLASSAAVRHDATIRIDVAENIWPKPIRKGVVVFGKIIMLIFCVYITGICRSVRASANAQKSIVCQYANQYVDSHVDSSYRQWIDFHSCSH